MKATKMLPLGAAVAVLITITGCREDLGGPFGPTPSQPSVVGPDSTSECYFTADTPMIKVGAHEMHCRQ